MLPSSNKRTILQLPDSLLMSVVPRVSGQEVSLKSFVFIKLYTCPRERSFLIPNAEFFCILNKP